MIINNRKRMTNNEILTELDDGKRLIIYPYCYSLIFFSKKLYSNPYLVENNTQILLYGIKYNLFTFFLGWWSLPSGPFMTINILFSNIFGGSDVTNSVRDDLIHKINGTISEIDKSITEIQNYYVNDKDYRI